MTAVIVVVVVAAVGLYFAVMAPPAPVPAAEGAGAPPVAEGTLDAPAATSADAPPAEAFGMPAQGAAPAQPEAVGVAPAPGAAPAGRPAAAGGPVPTAAAIPASSVTAPAPAAPAAPGRSYVIRAGDTLEAIARRELGDGQRWKAIVDANPGLDPKNLKIGRTIALPEGGGSTAAASGSAPAKPAAEAAAAPGGSTYTVQKGDTLFGIARKVYGSGSDAEIRRIVEANKGQLQSKDTPLKPGMKLAIPAKK